MSDDPYANIHPLLRPKFPFFAHRTLREVDDMARLEMLARAGKIAPYQMIRLREMQQKAKAIP